MLFFLYFLLMIGTLWGFYTIIQNIEHLKIEHSEFFIMCSGLLLYTSGTLIMLLLKRYIDKHSLALSNDVWCVHDMLNLIKNGAITYCLLLTKQTGVE